MNMESTIMVPAGLYKSDGRQHSIYTQQPTPLGMYNMIPQYAAQPPTLYSNGPSVMTPTGSPRPAVLRKPSMLLDTDMDHGYLPSTPPLSTSGSTVGSPQNFDVLQTPMNPMFSGLDEPEMPKEFLESIETTMLDWSSCGSPPMTPMYLESQMSKAPSLNSTTTELLSCPSLSPSPAPYARSVASDQEVNSSFCDPRNLTVGLSSVNSTLTPDHSIASTFCKLEPRGEPIKCETIVAPTQPHPVFDFNLVLPDGLPSFEELSDLESEEDFVNSLVHLDNQQQTSDISRPRACTGSSVVSLGHCSFIGEEELNFEKSEDFHFHTFPSPPSTTTSFDDGNHRVKRVKKSHAKSNRPVAPIMTTAAVDAESGSGQQNGSARDAVSEEHDNSTSGSDEPNAPTRSSAPTSRRGRKQSLTEDPSKTFVCDLCNRRFRRQEHLKRHYRSLHTQEKPFECHECGKKFSRSDNLAQHARTHGSGAIVMNLLEDGEVPVYEPGAMPPPGAEDYSTYGKVLFQITSELPGSGSEMSSDEGDDDGNKKRKRAE